MVTFSASASDNCDPSPDVVCIPPSGSVFPLGSTDVTCTATDTAGNNSSCSFAVMVVNGPPAISSITGPSSPLALGSSSSLAVDYTDNGAQSHTVTVSWDDGSSDTYTQGAATTGSLTASHTYAAAGVYSISVTVVDGCGASVTSVYQFIVIYDPEGGFVTGGGWIMSQAGSYVADESLTGKANFGFVSKYQKGATVPTGNTEFQFKAGNFNFKSTSYEWLVVSGHKAQYKGSGKVNGGGDYRFLLSVIDGQQPGGGGVDKFRIKIWDAASGGLVYDNKRGSSDDIDSANPQEIGGGSIVIHK